MKKILCLIAFLSSWTAFGQSLTMSACYLSGSSTACLNPVAITSGGTGVTSVTTVPAATAFAGWDANKNISADSFISGYTSTATGGTTTTLTVDSTFQQFFTGSTTQTVKLPVTSTLVLGQQFQVTNLSTGIVTVQSSGSNTIQALNAGDVATFTCILTSGTTAASWSLLGTVVPGTSAGLVDSKGVPGITDGSAAPAGYYGEEVIASSTSNTITTSLANMASITPPAGTWDISVLVAGNGTSIAAAVAFGISTTTASFSGTTVGLSQSWFAVHPTTGVGGGSINAYRVNTSGSTTYFLVTQASTGYSSTGSGTIRAIRVH